MTFGEQEGWDGETDYPKEFIEWYEKEGPTRFDTVMAMGKIKHGVINSDKPLTRKQVLESVSKEELDGVK